MLYTIEIHTTNTMKLHIFDGLFQEIHKATLPFVIGIILGALMMAMLRSGPVISNDHLEHSHSSQMMYGYGYGYEVHCSDLIDNDGDTLVDCTDVTDCSYDKKCEEICHNSIDDDGDLDVDCDDAYCADDPGC
jgi:hypothetical protein